VTNWVGQAFSLSGSANIAEDHKLGDFGLLARRCAETRPCDSNSALEFQLLVEFMETDTL
jgi:hypothetical protein